MLDGSAVEFCRHLEEIGVDRPGRAAAGVRDRPPLRGRRRPRQVAHHRAGRRAVGVLPAALPAADRRAVLRLRLSSPEAYRDEIAPARTFGFMRDLKMMNELGLGSGRPARQLHPGRRGQRHQHRAALPRRVRPPQDPRHHRRPLPARLPDPRPGHRPPHRPPRQHRAAAQDPRGSHPVTPSSAFDLGERCGRARKRMRARSVGRRERGRERIGPHRPPGRAGGDLPDL